MKKKRLKIIWDFGIQTDQLIQDTRTSLVLIKKKKIKYNIVDFEVSTDPKVLNKERKTEQLTLIFPLN